MIKKVSFALILLFLVMACASPLKYDNKLNQLVGANKAELLKEMGTPSASKVFANGDEVIAYVKANDVYVPSEFYLYNQNGQNAEDVYSPFLENSDFSPYESSFGYQVEYICQTAFLLQNGVVTAWKWRGNDCESY
ncbi:MAG: hypothetical protein E7012_04855 [Alphaproteobacteria bacterium]|nr:hypothetical protein [Alphaproteobacteria bacterium]